MQLKNLSQLLDTLQIAQYVILVAQNKQDYISLIQLVHPSLIVLDLLMKEADGWQICQNIRHNSSTNYIPLVLINSSGDVAAKVKELSWQNVDCIAESSEAEKIVYLIQNRLSKKKKSLTNKSNFNEDSRLGVDKPSLPHRLPRVDNDIDNFASVVSHDLQAPLRSLTMFAELLISEYQNDLDIKGQEYLERISNSSSRMQALIENLRVYSLAGKGEQTWITVDLNQVYNQVVENLQFEIAQAQAKIEVGDLPKILINPTEISQVLQNLLENAIKFSGEQTPNIQVNATATEKEWLISIRDNGIGIPEEFQSQIFQAFHRLNSADVYPGAGIGLAICQKIIESYGGSIGVKSIPAEGSTFYFTLPFDMCSSDMCSSPQVAK